MFQVATGEKEGLRRALSGAFERTKGKSMNLSLCIERFIVSDHVANV